MQNYGSPSSNVGRKIIHFSDFAKALSQKNVVLLQENANVL